MQAVAHHLQIEARRRQGIDRDLFARTAYNRYYYGCFLKVRELIMALDKSFGKPTHARIRDMMKDILPQKLEVIRKNAVRARDRRLVQMASKSIASSKRIGEILERAYGVRIFADYSPDVLINFADSKRFDLNSVDITEAHGWYDEVVIHSAQILQTWRQLHD